MTAVRALGDVRVLDLTVALAAGPTCVRQLADWGADVVRIDQPQSAASAQSIIGSRDSSDFQNLHRNKRSVCLNLKHERGRELFYELVKSADVIVENMRPPVKKRLGIEYETLQAINPRIVYGSISGFGQDGPYSERGGVDQIAQGLGGLMSVTGAPDGGPMRVGIAIADSAAGMNLAFGIVAALRERDRSGLGQWVTTSLLESMIVMLDFQATRWTVDGVIPQQEGNDHPTRTPTGCFATKDGYLNLAAPSDRLWIRLCEVIGSPTLASDPRFKSGAVRTTNRVALDEIIQDCLAKKTTGEWVDLFSAAGVPAGPVNNIAEVFADPQVRHLQMVQEVNHPRLGELRLIRSALSMSRTPSHEAVPTPEIGEHTESILMEIGISEEELEELRLDGAV